MKMIRVTMIASAALVCGTTAMAAPSAANSAAPAVEPATATGPVDLQTATCSQFERALFMANPGKNPSEDRQDSAIAAQDVLIQGLMWVSGYLSGRSQGKAVVPFDDVFITTTIEKLYKNCQASGPDSLFVDAAAKL